MALNILSGPVSLTATGRGKEVKSLAKAAADSAPTSTWRTRRCWKLNYCITQHDGGRRMKNEAWRTDCQLSAVELINISGWLLEFMLKSKKNVLLILLINFMPLSVRKCQSSGAISLAHTQQLLHSHMLSLRRWETGFSWGAGAKAHVKANCKQQQQQAQQKSTNRTLNN